MSSRPLAQAVAAQQQAHLDSIPSPTEADEGEARPKRANGDAHPGEEPAPAGKRGRPKKEDPDATPSNHDPRPTIKIVENDMARIIDKAERALIAGERGIFQRDGRIVSVVDTIGKTHAGADVITKRVGERDDAALTVDFDCSAQFVKFDGRSGKNARANPPRWIAEALRARGEFRFPVLMGVISAPTLRADGSLLERPGYDAKSGLLYDPAGVEFPAIPDRQTRDEAMEALQTLRGLVATFPFVGVSESVFLAGMFTALVRRSLPAAPLFGFGAPAPGTGKSKLVDVISNVAEGHEAAVLGQGPTDEEFEKRLGAALLGGDSFIAIDNCTRPLGDELLCRMLTQPKVKTRVLGQSKTPEMTSNAFTCATGNGLTFSGDMTRRSLLCSIDAEVENPETRVFDFDPVKRAAERRPEYVVAALTILRAFIVAGRPGVADLPVMGGFEDWTALVRGSLVWIGMDDPFDSVAGIFDADPIKNELLSVVEQWILVFGHDHFSVAEAIKKASEKIDDNSGNSSERKNPELFDALYSVAGDRGQISAKRLGKWFAGTKDKVINSKRFELWGVSAGTRRWILSPVDRPIQRDFL
jgi:putative DNA primase/helicase